MDIKTYHLEIGSQPQSLYKATIFIYYVARGSYQMVDSDMYNKLINKHYIKVSQVKPFRHPAHFIEDLL